MNANGNSQKSSTSRREFLKDTTSILAGASLAGAIGSRANAGENNTIKIALVGCGGRGTGAAANALKTNGPTKLVAVADVFENRAANTIKNLSKNFAAKVDAPKDRRFIGMDGYRKAIDTIAPGGVVLLATPPAFRPMHMEYAVSKGCHVFMEKSFAVDAPGIRRVLKAGKAAEKKNLKIALIGDLITCWAYREHTPVGFSAKREGTTEMAHQIGNYSSYTWLNGSFILDWLIHNLDVCCWCKDAWPVSAQGQGGRQVRTKADQLFDHYAVEYRFPDGTRLFAQGRHMHNCWPFFGDIIHGTTGSAVLGEGVSQPRIFKGHRQRPEDVIWKYEGPRWNAYDTEHALLFEAIRKDKPHNETERCAYAAMTGILGRMAAESGQMITWEQAMASDLELAPGLDNYTMASDPPVKPDSNGNYPIAMPGQTKVL